MINSDVVELIDVVSSHHERAVVRAGDLYIKVETDLSRAQAERVAMAAAPVPSPDILWWHDGPPSVLAMPVVPGSSLAKLGEESPHPPEAWRVAGEAARQLHDTEPAEGLAAAPQPLASRIEELHRWLRDNAPVDDALVDTVAAFAHRVLDDHRFRSVFVHGDLQAEHVIIRDGKVSGIIDWSEAGAGDALRDIAVLTQGHREYLDDVVAGYGRAVDTEVLRGYWALSSLNGVKFMLSHGYDASDDIAGLARCAARITSPSDAE